MQQVGGSTRPDTVSLDRLVQADTRRCGERDYSVQTGGHKPHNLSVKTTATDAREAGKLLRMQLKT